MPNVNLFQAVRAESTVALSGESADEVFGGYSWFHDPKTVNAATFPWLAAATTGSMLDGTQVLDADLLERDSRSWLLGRIRGRPGSICGGGSGAWLRPGFRRRTAASARGCAATRRLLQDPALT